MVHGGVSGAVCRRVCCVGAPLIALFFFVSYRNSVNEELEALRLRLSVSVGNAESLAAQLKVINEHKQKIETHLRDEKHAGGLLESELASLKIEMKTLTRQLNDTKANLTTFTSQMPTHIMRTEAVETSSTLDLAKSTVIFAPNVVSGVYNSTKRAQPSSTTVDVTPPNGIILKRSTPNTQHSVRPDELHHENYAAGSSVHFHRRESAAKNVEFRRQLGENNHPGELPSDDARITNKTSNKPLLLQILGRRPARPIKKKNWRKDARENDDNEENVVDFRHDDDPEQKNEADYKEMPV